MRIQYSCDYCGGAAEERQSHYKRKKRHFCKQECYSLFRKERLPKEEQHAYKGGGLPVVEKLKRMKARSDANHALRDGILQRKPCEACGNNKTVHIHHHDYNKPLDVRFLCRRCHWDEHKIIYENSELIK